MSKSACHFDLAILKILESVQTLSSPIPNTKKKKKSVDQRPDPFLFVYTGVLFRIGWGLVNSLHFSWERDGIQRHSLL